VTHLRAGTRGSDLALWQTRWVCERLKTAHPENTTSEVIIKTHGDVALNQRFDADWPVGGFVGAIEQALAHNEIDFAVHSYKDLQTAVTPGLIVAAVPGREVVHDVLVTRDPIDLDNLPDGYRIGTSSPRRTAQFKRLGRIEIVPIRGNVPTRLRKIEQDDYDGVILAAAGMKRLGLDPPNRIDLPTDRFVPSPAQGALAIQTREGDPAETVVAAVDDPTARRAVTAERSFLHAVNAGCHTPLGALATVDGTTISLRAQLFSEDSERGVEATESGDDPVKLGQQIAKRLLEELNGCK
jgi:hydroxymethylbilane synthase